MQAFPDANSYIASHAGEPDAAVLRLLADSLMQDAPFALGRLYELQHDHFQLAIHLLQDWRLRRYWMGNAHTSPADQAMPAAGPVER